MICSLRVAARRKHGRISAKSFSIDLGSALLLAYYCSTKRQTIPGKKCQAVKRFFIIPTIHACCFYEVKRCRSYHSCNPYRASFLNTSKLSSRWHARLYLSWALRSCLSPPPAPRKAWLLWGSTELRDDLPSSRITNRHSHPASWISLTRLLDRLWDAAR